MLRITRSVRFAGFVVAAAASWLACDETKPSCTYSLSKTSIALPAAGGSDTLSVTASAPSCSWSVTSNASWVSVGFSGSGTGSGSVAISAGANGVTARSATLSVAGQSVTVTQDGLPPPTYTLSGRVTDAFLGFPPGSYGLPGVSVTVAGPSQHSTTTDSGGNYTVDDLLAGNYTVGFVKTGYVSSTTTVAISGATTLLATLTLEAPSPPSTSNLAGTWTGTGTYPNDPFKLALGQNGTDLRGTYIDQHDSSSAVTGSYTGASFTLRVDFGDAVLFLDCTVDNARQVSGVQRTPALGNRAYPFTMTR
jgi:hypothetical protein